MLFDMTLVERINEDLTAAMKARTPPRTSALRMAKAALRTARSTRRRALDDAEAVKRAAGPGPASARTPMFQFRKANRPELVQKEEKPSSTC